ncbi:hypothetical protein T484DRAFT_1761744, partial [Baffinella frigidus]
TESEAFYLVAGAPSKLRAAADTQAEDLLLFGADLEASRPAPPISPGRTRQGCAAVNLRI